MVWEIAFLLLNNCQRKQDQTKDGIQYVHFVTELPTPLCSGLYIRQAALWHLPYVTMCLLWRRGAGGSRLLSGHGNGRTWKKGYPVLWAKYRPSLNGGCWCHVDLHGHGPELIMNASLTVKLFGKRTIDEIVFWFTLTGTDTTRRYGHWFVEL